MRTFRAFLLLSFSLVLVMPMLNGCAQTGEVKSSEELLEHADELFNSGEYEKALESYRKITTVASKENNRSVLTKAYSQIARCYLKQNDVDSAKQWLSKAKEYAIPDDPMG